MDSEKRNLMLAMMASLAIFAGYYYFYERHQHPVTQQQPAQTAEAAPQQTVAQDLPLPLSSVPLSYEEAKKGTQIAIKTNTLSGSLSLTGARLDDLLLTQYKETTNPDSGSVRLLSPAGTAHAYYMESGWVSPDKTIGMPTATTVWTADKSTLSPGNPVTLSWKNPQGVEFRRLVTIDDQYMITVTDSIQNGSTHNFQAHSFGLISRTNPEENSNSYALHEGAVGYLEGKLKEEKFKDIQNEKAFTYGSTGGWFGFTDKYWLTALVPFQSQNVTAKFRSVGTEGQNRYQADFTSPATLVQPGMTVQNTFHFYAGAKSVDILDGYEKTLNIPHFDLAIDFGWFYFITKPLFFVLQKLYDVLGNFALSIIVLTLMIRALLFPLANKSYQSMAKMKDLQPQLTRIKEQAGDDKVKLNRDMMALYKQHKVNPVSGCLPMFLQIPVLFAIYKVLLISIEMRHAPLFGWIKDMSAPDPTSFFNLFGLIPWAPPSFLMIGALPLLMGGTMFLQQKLSPQPMDAMQSKMFLIMPFIFTYMLAQFPAGVVFYWTLTNILAIAQQWAIMQMDHKKKGKK
ncbi:MAG: membrane protein insertase YidC [Alphaproteobacteria bacterium RIFCSPHIGHO2_01_FULL_41_14]|nr:MAG: membrane protein insertase YidC [Alphaproteobacteria bacterium GWB1_45_5]OFW76686.1 MAG: membrane protein insertase YidC [Alphaproteobacteria bacterium GWA1_45_9]OFW89765.1 MAG: membrane protein insertase YidC [Alphaproteobacteria bacterium RIFCSPHIGHO2_01_FULL_41_14]HCI48437.1 membrane protein insertase YidC [Holosporales bacterium]